MTATVTNKTLHTGSMTNKERSARDLTWDEATFTWDQAQGTWDEPYGISNKALHTGTMTNKALS